MMQLKRTIRDGIEYTFDDISYTILLHEPSGDVACEFGFIPMCGSYIPADYMYNIGGFASRAALLIETDDELIRYFAAYEAVRLGHIGKEAHFIINRMSSRYTKYDSNRTHFAISDEIKKITEHLKEPVKLNVDQLEQRKCVICNGILTDDYYCDMCKTKFYCDFREGFRNVSVSSYKLGELCVIQRSFDLVL